MATAEMNAGAPPIARDSSEGWIPPVPESVEETGLSEEAVADLLLKVLYVQGARSGDSLTKTVALPFDIVDNVLLDLQQRRFIEVRNTQGHGRGGYTFDISGEGRERAREALEGNQYVGPAPVPLEHYRAATLKQSVGEVHITRSRIREGFDDLVLDEALFEALGPAVNSAKSLFLYGAPGNGKTHMAEIIARLMGSASVWVPFAIDVDGQVVVLFDPVHHQRVEKQVEEGDGSVDDLLVRKERPYDRRFVHIRRPIVMTGGELTMTQLDLEYDRHTKMYQAPFQVKANGGVLIIDDFGRQRVPPHELLNRWIVPLEKRRDYLTLHTGVKFPVPFDALIIFATNLDPSDLVDEAFMRRIHYKIEVPSPNRDQYEIIFERACEGRSIPYDPRAVEYIYRKYYGSIGIEPRGCHPRDITDHVLDYARYVEAEPKLTPELIDSACDSYFRVMAADDMREAGVG
ncbi:MAG: ATP-binding protein [Gemmatimonadota bacterium]